MRLRQILGVLLGVVALTWSVDAVSAEGDPAPGEEATPAPAETPSDTPAPEKDEEKKDEKAAEDAATPASPAAPAAPEAPAATPPPAATPAPAAPEPAAAPGRPAADAPAAAPEPAAPAADDEPIGKDVEVITVTGSRIKQKTLATPAPVTTLTREELQLTGMVSIGEILQNLTANSNGINVNFNNGGNGATRVNLRGIGAARTLVLLNGRRFVGGGDGADSSVDLNAIPAAIIERVEVLKDGASAVYGSDAIGGVVNIITRRQFDGVEFSIFGGTSGEGDAEIIDLSVTTGITGKKGNFVLSLSYYEQKPVFAGDREGSRIDRSYNFDPEYDPATDGDRVTDGGSSATPAGSIIDRLGCAEGETEGCEQGNQAWQDTECAPGDFCYNDPADPWRGFNTGGNSDEGTGDFFNYQPDNYLVTPQFRYNLFAAGDYSLDDSLRVYFEGSYSRRVSDQLLAPTPLFIISEGITVSADNEHNPFGRDFIDVRRRMVEAGRRHFKQEIDTFRGVVGLDGDIPEMGTLTDWKWDISFNYGRTSGININEGRFIRSRVVSALGPADQCTGDCVQLDLFGGEGSITDEMLDYISYTGTATGFSDQLVLNANAGGNLYEVYPGHNLGLAFGYEYRDESGAFLPDPVTASGDTTGNKQEPTSGSYDVHAGFIELSIPVLANMTGVELFELSAAARFFNYNTFGSDLTYKFGARWQIADFLAVRGTYSTAYRAPSITELFAGTADSFPAATDPCATDENGEGRSPNAAANCTADGLPANLNDPSTQLRARVGGNPNLDPETANTITAGIVLEPTLLDGLSATIDFWSIDIEDGIQPVGANVILSQCYENDPGDRQFCNLIERDENNLIRNINDTESNVGGVETSGLDFSLRYQNKFDWGQVSTNFDFTYLLDYTEILPDGYKWDGRGVYDLGAFPEARFNIGAVWSLDGWLAGFNLHYVGGFKECDDSVLCNSEREAGTDAPVSRDVDSNTVVDLHGGYSFESPIGDTEIAVGINNIFDQAPPVIYTGFLGDSDGSTYDYIGRFFYFRLTQRL